MLKKFKKSFWIGLLYLRENSERMSLDTFVKVSRISNLSDARYCAGMGVNQLGFNFNTDEEDAVSPELFLEIKNWVAGVQFVGEFGYMPAESIVKAQRNLPLDLIETANLDAVEEINLLGKPISFRISVDHHVHLQDLTSTLSYLDELVTQVVIDSTNEELFDEIKTEANFYNGRLKLIKAFNVHVNTLNQLDGFMGVQLTAAAEDQPGFKDYGEVMDLLEALELQD